jgi:hypothetical protein
MSDEIDADEMAVKILAIINGTKGISRLDRLFAGMMVVGDVLVSIECPGCRESAAQAVLKAFPLLIEEALGKAAVRSPGSHHKH